MKTLYLNNSEVSAFCKVKRQKQNHKISFHFFSGSPHTPRRKWIGKEIFGFGSRPEGARGAHCSLHQRNRSVRIGKEPPRAPRVRQSSKSCGFCSYNVRTSSKKHRQFSLLPETAGASVSPSDTECHFCATRHGFFRDRTSARSRTRWFV